MPKNISTPMKNHIAGECTTIATLWEIIRQDGIRFGFTDHDVDISYEGDNYEAALGYTPTAVDTTSDLNVDNMEIHGILDTQSISDEELTAGVWDYARVTCMMINWADPTMAAVAMRCGRLGEVKTGRSTFVAELRGLTQNIQQPFGTLYMPTCSANLGDEKCNVDLAPFTFAGEVSGVVTRSIFYTDLADPDDKYKGGLLTWLTGANAGLKMEIKASRLASGEIDLQRKMAYEVLAGDTFEAHWGCDKLAPTCHGTYDNIKNMRSFHQMPGVYKYTTGKS